MQFASFHDHPFQTDIQSDPNAVGGHGRPNQRQRVEPGGRCTMAYTDTLINAVPVPLYVRILLLLLLRLDLPERAGHYRAIGVRSRMIAISAC